MLMLPIPGRRGRLPCRIHTARVDDDWIVLTLAGGGIVRLPTVFSMPLYLASPTERGAWRISSSGRTIRWPSLGVVVGIKRTVRHRGNASPRHRRPANSSGKLPGHSSG